MGPREGSARSHNVAGLLHGWPCSRPGEHEHYWAQAGYGNETWGAQANTGRHDARFGLTRCHASARNYGASGLRKRCGRKEGMGGGGIYEGENTEARGATPYLSRPSLTHFVSTADSWRHKYIGENKSITRKSGGGGTARGGGRESRCAIQARHEEARRLANGAEILKMRIERTVSSLGGGRLIH